MEKWKTLVRTKAKEEGFYNTINCEKSVVWNIRNGPGEKGRKVKRKGGGWRFGTE